MDKDQDPIITPLQDAAASLHEVFTSFIEAGFTRDEALRLVIASMLEE